MKYDVIKYFGCNSNSVPDEVFVMSLIIYKKLQTEKSQKFIYEVLIKLQ